MQAWFGRKVSPSVELNETTASKFEMSRRQTPMSPVDVESQKSEGQPESSNHASSTIAVVKRRNLLQNLWRIVVCDESDDDVPVPMNSNKRFPWIHCRKTMKEYRIYQKSFFDIYQCKIIYENDLFKAFLSVKNLIKHSNLYCRYSRYRTFRGCFHKQHECARCIQQQLLLRCRAWANGISLCTIHYLHNN